MKCLVWEKSFYKRILCSISVSRKYLIVPSTLKVQTLNMYGLIHFNGLRVLQINGRGA